jgi:hypothetical protein
MFVPVRDWVDLSAMAGLEGTGRFKNGMTSLGMEPATSRTVAQCLTNCTTALYTAK